MNVFTRATATGAWVARAHKADDIIIADAVNERSTASVALLDPLGTAHYYRGMGVRIEHQSAAPTTADSTLVTADDTSFTADVALGAAFEGFVSTASEARLGVGGTREHHLDCMDLHYLADKRVVAAAFQNVTAGSIVNTLITGYLATEGVTAGTIQAGPLVRAITFNYVTVADAIQELAGRAGFWWRITPAGLLDFMEPAAVLPATAVDLDVVALADTISVTRHSPAYRNRQWVKGGRDRTLSQIETQYGDGEARAFVLGYDVAEEPTIEVSRAAAAFAAETVGEAGIQAATQWFYSPGKNSVYQDSGGTVLAAVDRVRVTYTGAFDVVARVDNADRQAERALVEGGSGVIERVLTDKTSDSSFAAFQLAGELIAYYGRAAITLRFATATLAWVPGQVKSVTLAEAGITAEDALVASVEWFTRAGVDHAVVTLVIGPLEGSWAQWFGALSRRIDRLADPLGAEAEVITTLETFSKTWSAVEVPNIFYQAFPGAGTFPAAALLAAFVPADRVRLMAWSYAGAELGRKFITTQSGAATDEIETVTSLTTLDAVGDIDELVWIGGAMASGAAGTGVEVDRQAFVKTKTNIEQVQVTRTDTKWA